MDTFNAGVQYNDFKGTVAADISDNVALADYLVSLGKAESDERVVGFRIASGENRGTPVTDVSLVAYLLRSAEFEPAPAAVRAVEVRVTPEKPSPSSSASTSWRRGAAWISAARTWMAHTTTEAIT
jgi:hypothetical protein